MTLEPDTVTDPAPTAPAAHALELRKTYGTGQATVHALAGINVTFERGRFSAVSPSKLWPMPLNDPDVSLNTVREEPRTP